MVISKQGLRKAATVSLRLLAWFGVVVFFVWSVGALYYLTLVPPAVGAMLAAVYLAGGIISFVRIQPRSRWLSIAATSIAIVYVVTLFQRPSNDRLWDPSQVVTTGVEIENGHATIHGFRHCHYRSETDFDVHYEDFQFRIEDLTSVAFLVHKFSPVEGLAHTFLSFELDSDDGPQYFSVSVEIRREVGEIYSPIRGLYRQYEVLYVIGDERDVIGVRTVVRPQDRVHMYHVNATPKQVQQLFANIAERIEKLRTDAEFYHTLLNNCTNGIVFHTYHLTPEPINWLDPRIVMPGFSDQFAHAQGLIGAQGESFQTLHNRSRIDQTAEQVGLSDRFSDAIRDNLNR